MDLVDTTRPIVILFLLNNPLYQGQCVGGYTRGHISSFHLHCYLFSTYGLNFLYSAVDILAWHAVYVVLSWAGNMTGDRKIVQFHACIGCSSMLFGQSAVHHSERPSAEQLI